jgi:GNAT superfamily N-acetyltransferase
MSEFTVSRLTSLGRLGELIALVHAAFACFEPPSSVINESIAEFAARQRDGLIFVAQPSGTEELIGSVFVARKGDALYLTRLAVRVDWRRRGVARALIGAVQDEARRVGASRLTGRVRISLPANRRYFESFGFIVTGEGADPGRPDYYAMQRPLRHGG